MNLNRSVNIDATRFFNKKDVTEYLFFNMCEFTVNIKFIKDYILCIT